MNKKKGMAGGKHNPLLFPLDVYIIQSDNEGLEVHIAQNAYTSRERPTRGGGLMILVFNIRQGFRSQSCVILQAEQKKKKKCIDLIIPETPADM